MAKEPIRRRFLQGTAATLATGLAGCLSGNASDDSGGSGGSDEMLSDSFDPASPAWGENNYTVDQLLDVGYERGSETDLNNMQEREEVRYGDPVQQTPEDESEWLDPDVLVMSQSPSEETPGQYEDALEVVFENIEKETGKDVEFRALTSYAAAVEAMRSERLHFCNFNTGAVPFAVNLAGAVPCAVGLGSSGQFGYRLFATTHVDNNDIQSVNDFAGANVAHSEPTSNSGNQAPRALFEQEFGVVPGEDYEVEYSGGHDQTTRGVYAKDYDAGPICSTCLRDVVEDADLDATKLKVVWASSPFPSGPMAYRYNLHPDIQEGFVRALTEYDYSGTLYEEQADYNRFVPIEYKTHWDIILTIQKFNGVEYEPGSLNE